VSVRRPQLGGDMSDEPKRRAVEAEVEIAAPVEAVWKALSEAEELTRWFPPEARVEPGLGGSIRIAWDGNWMGESRITAWDPPRRLRTVTEQAPFDASGKPIAGVPPLKIAIDYEIEARGGGARLRLVHSGFGPDADWDGEVEGVRRGWGFELPCLRHYLERHRGRDRHACWIFASTDVPETQALERLRSGFLGGFTVAGLSVGAPYSLRLATGDALSGATLVSASWGFSGTAAEWGDGVFRVSVDALGGRTLVHAGLETWRVAGERVADFKARAEAALQALFPQA
ncbi:MAG TPA: SRPBCC domain-containing protein, partial [Vicinamibacteria bacterium]|nr:SRPBCC domain-containing protein [Vicinamibacteria bacterium]